MYVLMDDIRRCLDEARTMREYYKQYVLNGDSARKSVDQLQMLITQYLEKQVEVLDVPVAKTSISAFYWAMRDGTYKVFLLSGLDDREKRFAKCKELFHVVLDVVDCRNMSLYSHLSEVAATFPVVDSKPQLSSTVSEKLAEIAAMEFLFPYKDRLTFLANGNGNADYDGCAERYGIPRSFVEAYCSDLMMETFGRY